MKKILLIIVIVATAHTSFSQDIIFNGVYKGSSNGIPYTLYLQNNNGTVKGTLRNSERASIESVIEASIIHTNYVEGIQKHGKKKRHFIAIEENDQLIWEIKYPLLKRVFSANERLIKFTRSTIKMNSPSAESKNKQEEASSN